MVGRFSDRARLVIVLAEQEARTLGHAHIGTEHLLLGLVREERSPAAKALASLGFSAERVRAQIVRIVGSRDEPPRGEIHFSERARDALEQALRKAFFERKVSIAPEHILIGLTYQGTGVADRVLRELKVDSAAISKALDRAPYLPTTSERHREALKRANEIRLTRARMKRDLEDGRPDP